jgi:competence protein ComEC
MQNTGAKRKSKLKKRVIYTVCTILLLVSLVISFGSSFGVPSWNEIFAYVKISANLGQGFSLSFVDVDSADACYIKCADKNILVDTGTSLSYYKLSTYLKRYGCTHFDAIILSHPYSDHIGGTADVIKDFGTDVIYASSTCLDAISQQDDFADLKSIIDENNIKVISPEIESTITIGDLSLDFISPQKTYKGTNNNSLVFRLRYGKISALFTGDISKEVENDLINSNTELKSDILKVSHHGSKTSSSEEFLQAVSPQISVVSVGESNLSLPDSKAIAYINHYSGSLYRTDEDGSVVITSDGNTLQVQTNA